jgi:hypothetical protein
MLISALDPLQALRETNFQEGEQHLNGVNKIMSV